MYLAIGLLIIGVLTRFLPHAPNFSPVVAIALFGGVYLRKSQALVLPVLLMIVSDFFLGLYPSVVITWMAVAVCGIVGLWVRQSPGIARTFVGAVASAVVFFLISNFGSFLDLYPRTWQGLVSCYTMAVPFFRMTLVSSVVFSAVLFGTYELAVRKVRGTAMEPVLL